MSNEQSIRDELANVVKAADFSAPDSSGSSEEFWHAWKNHVADQIMASPVIRRIQAEALRKFRADLIGSQFVRYGIVLPDINEVVDDLDERADAIERGETA